MKLFFWFVWCLLYVNHPTTIAALKIEITNVINGIPQATCQRVIQNFKKRIQTCLERNGRHLEHIIKQSGRHFSFGYTSLLLLIHSFTCYVVKFWVIQSLNRYCYLTWLSQNLPLVTPQLWIAGISLKHMLWLRYRPEMFSTTY